MSTTIVDTYNTAVLQLQHPADRITRMWQTLGDKTAACVAEGVLTLAGIWQAAWVQGQGDAIEDLNAVDKDALRTLYTNVKFTRSVELADVRQSRVLEPRTIDQLVTL